MFSCIEIWICNLYTQEMQYSWAVYSFYTKWDRFWCSYFCVIHRQYAFYFAQEESRRKALWQILTCQITGWKQLMTLTNRMPLNGISFYQLNLNFFCLAYTVPFACDMWKFIEPFRSIWCVWNFTFCGQTLYEDECCDTENIKHVAQFHQRMEYYYEHCTSMSY